MTTGGTGRMLAALTTFLGLATTPVLAAAGTDQPQPCAVTYAATPHGAGSPITTTFAVNCTADPEWEVTSLEQQTTLRDMTPTGTSATCHQQVSGTSATQPCSLTGARLHTYAVIYRVKVWGNYSVCVDDGTCDSLTPVEDPACARTSADPHPGVDATSVVLDCTYEQVVTVEAT